MDEIDVPSHFFCPISLQLMRYPVTVRTGFTCDRENIETWLFSCKNRTCPITKLSILDTDLTQTTRFDVSSRFGAPSTPPLGPSVFPLPSHPSTKSRSPNSSPKQINPHTTISNAPTRLRSITFKSDMNRINLEPAGAIEFLASALKSSSGRDAQVSLDDNDDECTTVMGSEAAVEVLYHLKPSESHVKNLISNEGIKFIESLIQILRTGNYQSRAYATILLKSAFGVADPSQLINARKRLVHGTQSVARQDFTASYKGSVEAGGGAVSNQSGRRRSGIGVDRDASRSIEEKSLRTDSD